MIRFNLNVIIAQHEQDTGRRWSIHYPIIILKNPTIMAETPLTNGQFRDIMT